MSRYYNPVTVYCGARGCEELAAELETELSHVERVLVLTRGESVDRDESLAPLSLWVDQRETVLRELALSNPDLEDIASLTRDLGSFDYQLIIAIGGGSVMDVAKSLAATSKPGLKTVETLRSAVVERSYGAPGTVVPWIGIPTTSGTGSEVTKWATVWDRGQSCKRSILHDTLYARKALVLPQLTRTLPLRLSASTALDAMCQATEAYWSVRTNPITRIYALAAIAEIRTSLPRLKADPHALDVRERLAMASLYAGLAFSNTQTTACHSISYPLTLLRGIDHGIAVSITLAPVLRLNEPALHEPRKLYAAYGVEDAAGVGAVIRDLYDQYEIPARLTAYGVTEEDIPGIIDGAYTKGRMDNNPVAISEAQLHDMLSSLL